MKYKKPKIKITIIEEVETLVLVSNYEEEERPWLMSVEEEGEGILY